MEFDERRGATSVLSGKGSRRKESFGEIGVGLYDMPSAPDEDTVLTLNLLETNAVIVGSSMSGKTTMVKNVLARLNEIQPYRSCEQTYILDFGGNLSGSEYAKLGRVCACFDGSNTENIKRVLRTVEERFSQNSRLLNGETYLSYKQAEEVGKQAGALLPHITLVIENINAFLSDEMNEEYREILLRLTRDGLSKGVSVLATASGISDIPAKLMTLFHRKFALSLQPDQYHALFGRKADAPIQVPGRGLATFNATVVEFQAYRPFRDEEREIKTLIENSRAKDVEKLEPFPSKMTREVVSEYCKKAGISEYGAVGLDYSDHMLVAVDFSEPENIVIYGKRHFGQRNLLHLILDAAVGTDEEPSDIQFVFFSDAKEGMDKTLEAFKEYEDRIKTIGELKTFVETVRENNQREAAGAIVYVVKSRKLFLPGRTTLGFLLSREVIDANAKGDHFIFYDVPRIQDKSIAEDFNGLIRTAFLLDDIGTFLMGRGSTSVFNFMDAEEMKHEFAPCILGDGFYYDTGRDRLLKIKIINRS